VAQEITEEKYEVLIWDVVATLPRGIMKFGYFDDIHREYVIECPDTPLPWINYLGCENYFGIISNTAGGYSFYRDARLRRLTRYRYNHVPYDVGGRYLYIRDDGADLGRGEPLFWSPTWQPVRTPLDAYECRHGMGYTIIKSALAGIQSQIRYFIPLGENLEIWELSIINRREQKVQLSIFSLIEFALWDAWDDATNFQRNLSVGEVEVEGGVVYHKSEYRERRDHFAYFACSERVEGVDTQREAFLGPYRGWECPQAVEIGRVSDSIAHGWSPVGAHHVKFGLAPGGQKKIIFLLGYYENPKNQKFDPPGSQIINKRGVTPLIHRYLKFEEVDKAFHALGVYWDGLLNRFQVKTPNEHVDRMVNVWNAYQVMATFNFSRSASFFESGIGRGMGFRDSNQDLLAAVQMVPERSCQRILDLAATQISDGGAYHQYQTLTKQGNNSIGGNFNDDPLWLVLSVSAYIKETGDWEILRERVPFENNPGSEETLIGHLKRSLGYTLDRLGPHGLPLIGRADWNDCLNLNSFSEEADESFQTVVVKDGKTAESVFIAGQFIIAAKELVAMFQHLDRLPEAATYLQAAGKMEAAICQSGWDGAWFRRAYDDEGKPLGSRDCKEGQIFIEPQGICIMAGVGLEDGRAVQALDSVGDRLGTPHGLVLLQPAYTRYYLQYGEISSYPPGYKENAGVFCHTNPWIVIAEALVGRGDRAMDYYLRINPSAREEISELHKCEPYVYAQMISGKDAPICGEAKNSWLTGTAAWNYIAVTQWILGIRPTYDGLQVSPVIPQDWEGFTAQRLYRGVKYDINVRRVGPGNQVNLAVDTKPIDGVVIPLPSGRVREVRVDVSVG
jgi:cellobiose phosphorylase